LKLSKEHKELKDIAGRASRSMKQIILQSMTDVAIFKKLAEQKIDHYCGFHKHCEDKEHCKKSVHIKDLDARKAFIVIFYYFKFCRSSGILSQRPTPNTEWETPQMLWRVFTALGGNILIRD
jgi:hypothetical protein